MQKRQFAIASVLLCMMGFVFLTGCGESLFKGLDGDTAATTAQEASDRGDFARALTLSQAVIDNPNANTQEKQDAYVQKGIALMGINNISLLSMTKLLEDTDDANIVTTLSNLFQITPSASEEIAETFNTAYTLGGGDLGLSSLSSAHLATSSSTLDKNKQLLRGMANLSVVVKMTTRVFDIATEGTVTLITDNVSSYSEALDYLMISTATSSTMTSQAKTSSSWNPVNSSALSMTAPSVTVSAKPTASPGLGST